MNKPKYPESPMAFKPNERYSFCIYTKQGVYLRKVGNVCTTKEKLMEKAQGYLTGEKDLLCKVYRDSTGYLIHTTQSN